MRRIGAAFIAPTTVLRQPATTISKTGGAQNRCFQQFFVQEQLLHFSSKKHYCAKSGCYREQDSGSIYCSYHRPKTTSYYYYSRSKKNTRKTSSSNYSKRRVLPRTVILPAAITLLANRIVPMMTAMMPSMTMTTTMRIATIVIPITLTALMMQWMNSIGNRESHHEYSNNFI